MNKRIKELEIMERQLNCGRRQFGVALRAFVFVFSAKLIRLIKLATGWIISCIILISIALPLLIYAAARYAAAGKPVFLEKTVYGKNGNPIVIKYFNFATYYLKNASLFYYVFSGRLQLAGVSIKEYVPDNRSLGDACLFEAPPGIFNLWFLRSSSKIAHEGRQNIEIEYNYKRRLIGDLMLLIKSIPAAFFHVEAVEYQPEINLLGITFKNLTMRDAVGSMVDDMRRGTRKKAFFVNPDCFNKAINNNNYFALLKNADYIFPDGIGVHLACKMIKTPLRENVNGTDMLPFLVQAAVNHSFSIFLLGGKPGIAAAMKLKLENLYPGVIICGEQHGYFDRDAENQKIVDKINCANPDLLLVAFGVPHQEEWICRNFEQLNCRIAMGVGGLFDFYSGNIKRAPQWMREIGMEWFFRFLMEPSRMFKRYFVGNPLFVVRVILWRRHVRK
jgi:N-acetylglucosaminyldiphosphoundecaprenol N-acetyl-beta-D-mannosaminyltransferase